MAVALARLPAQPRGRVRGRRTLTVLGVLLFVLGAGLAALGAAQRADGGFFATSPARLSTPTSALITSEIDVGAQRPADPSVDVGDLGRVRIRATGGSPVPIFIGIGPTEQVHDYLYGSAYDAMSSYALDPLRVSYQRSVTSARPTPPTDQHFWVASASGAGLQDLQWDKRGGAWTAVAMNSDGSPGVIVTADLGLRFGFLLPLSAVMLPVGGCLLLLARTGGSRGGTARVPRTGSRPKMNAVSCS